MLRPFELSEPTSIAEASELLARHGDSARIYAGGTELILAMKEGLIHYEHLTEIVVPALPPRSAAAYLKFGFLERPSVGVGVAVTLDDGHVADARIAVGCVGPVPRRMREAEAELEGKARSESGGALAAAGRIAGRAADAITDLHGSAEYKEHLVGVLLRRAWDQALAAIDGSPRR